MDLQILVFGGRVALGGPDRDTRLVEKMVAAKAAGGVQWAISANIVAGGVVVKVYRSPLSNVVLWFGGGEGGQQAKVSSHAETCTNSMSPGMAACRFGRWEVHYCVAQEDRQIKMKSGVCWRVWRVFEAVRSARPRCKGGRGQNGDEVSGWRWDELRCGRWAWRALTRGGPGDEMETWAGPSSETTPESLFLRSFPCASLTPHAFIFLAISEHAAAFLQSASQQRSAAGVAGGTARNPCHFFLFLLVFFVLDCACEHGCCSLGLGSGMGPGMAGSHSPAKGPGPGPKVGGRLLVGGRIWGEDLRVPPVWG